MAPVAFKAHPLPRALKPEAAITSSLAFHKFLLFPHFSSLSVSPDYSLKPYSHLFVPSVTATTVFCCLLFAFPAHLALPMITRVFTGHKDCK